MQKITNSMIEVNRGDELSLSLSLQQESSVYTFVSGDKVVFSLYNKGKMNEKAILIKEVEATGGETALNISLTSEETKIGELINKPVEYWYEIELNDRFTVVGYDEEGAKKFILYPEGSKIQ
jgi:hypothetical protein